MVLESPGANKSRQRLWVVSELYYPEETSTGYFLTRIAEGLAKDFDVEVISGRPTYSERDVKVQAFETRNGTRIHRMPVTRFDKDNVVLRAVNLLSLTLTSFCFAIAKIRRDDLVLVVTNPPTISIFIQLAAQVKRAKAVLLVHDVYPEILAAAGILGRQSFAYRLLGKIFRAAYLRFDRIIVLGRDMLDVVRQKTGADETKVRIIPNWGDTQEVYPLAKQDNPFRRQFGLENKTILQFSGNIGRTHNVEVLLDAADYLRDCARIHILVIGYGAKAAFVKHELARRRLSNVTLLPRQPRKTLNDMLNASEATVISLVDDMYGLSVPSRMYNVMAAGVPIIALANKGSELARVVTESKSGWVYSEIDGEKLAALAREIDHLSNTGATEEKRQNARNTVLERFQFHQILQLYREELSTLADETKS